MRGRGDRGNVLDLERLRARRLGEHDLGVGPHQGGDAFADCGIVVGGLDPHPLQSHVGERARRPINGIGHQHVIAGAQRRHQRDDDRRQSRGHEHRSRRARKVGPGGAQGLGRGRAAGAVGKALRPVLERRDIGIEHGRAAKRRHVDEALRELGVAAEIHEARAAPQGRARFVGQFGHWGRAGSERRFGPLPSTLRAALAAD